MWSVGGTGHLTDPYLFCWSLPSWWAIPLLLRYAVRGWEGGVLSMADSILLNLWYLRCFKKSQWSGYTFQLETRCLNPLCKKRMSANTTDLVAVLKSSRKKLAIHLEQPEKRWLYLIHWHDLGLEKMASGGGRTEELMKCLVKILSKVFREKASKFQAQWACNSNGKFQTKHQNPFFSLSLVQKGDSNHLKADKQELRFNDLTLRLSL